MGQIRKNDDIETGDVDIIKSKTQVITQTKDK